MGNLVGERFDDFVNNQINARQSLAGKGFGEASLSNSQLLLLNNRNAWLKLASSVYVEGDNSPSTLNTGSGEYEDSSISSGEQRLKDIGINNTSELTGNQLAQNTVLFNTLSEVTPTTYTKDKETGKSTDKIITPGSYNFRSGVSRTGELWNSSNSYGLGGSNFGLTPAPGLISAKINCLSRGSIREAEIEIKAYNKFQFEILELSYLRLGFTMMLEWGWDKYTTDGKKIQNTENTIIEDHWFKDNSFSQLGMLNAIQSCRVKYAGNYDGFFGKVVNFDWSFNKNGTYDIKLKLITLGDVVESLKISPSSTPLTIGDLSLTDSNPTKSPSETQTNTAINAGTSALAQSLYIDIINPDIWNTPKSNYFKLDFPDRTKNPINDKLTYFITFSTLLQRIENFSIPSVGTQNNVEKQIKIDYVGDDNFCSAYPNQISFDPNICLIKPILTTDVVYSDGESLGEALSIDNENEEVPVRRKVVNTWDWFEKLKEFGSFDNDNKVLYGNVMNIYLNYNFIADCLTQNQDKEGNISIYKFIVKICDGINSSLGNLQQIEAVIRDDIYITIQDQNPIPGIELLNPRAAQKPSPFEIFGFNTVGSGSSNFVTDFNFNTKITPQLASMISIGTTANNISTKNYDGTAFSKWNNGLKDRFSSIYIDPNETLKNQEKGVNKSNILSNGEIDKEWDKWKEGKPDFYHGPEQSNAPNLLRDILPKTSLSAYGYPGDENSTPDKGIYRTVEKSFTTNKSYGTGFFEPPLTWRQYIQAVEGDLEAIQSQEALESEKPSIKYRNNYTYYLVRAFSGNFPNVAPITKPLYYNFLPKFIEEGKKLFKSHIISNNSNRYFNNQNTPGNTIGYIPIDLSITFQGLSGIKLYQQLTIKQGFLPPQYPKSLKFLIKQVNHNISSNNWSTCLNTLGIPAVKPNIDLGKISPNQDFLAISENALSSLSTPNADKLREYLTYYPLEFSGNPPFGGPIFQEKNGTELSEAGDITKELMEGMIILFTEYLNPGSLKNISGATKQVEETIFKNDIPQSTFLNPSIIITQILITAGNDQEHHDSKGNSNHTRGNALDFTITPLGDLSKREIENNKGIDTYIQVDIIEGILKKFIEKYPKFTYINEYYYPSKNATGRGHFHISYNS